MKNIYKIALAFLLVAVSSNAQQDPLFTQYMYNMSIVNPTYTTSDVGTINTGMIHRRQWVGLPDAGPITTSLFGHAAVNENIEVGISYYNDNQYDRFKTNDINADFAYKLNFDQGQVLSFGLKAGAKFAGLNGNFNLEDNTDIAFDNTSTTTVNLGAGMYFNTEKYYIGLSSPNLIQTESSNIDNVEYPTVQQIHAYLTAGYVFELSETLKFKPAFMTRYTEGVPLSLDLTANFLFNEKFEVGAAYRLNDAVSLLLNFRIIDDLRIGYAFDYTTSDLGFGNTSGSHEFLLLYDFNVLSKKYDKSPRFF